MRRGTPARSSLLHSSGVMGGTPTLGNAAAARDARHLAAVQAGLRNLKATVDQLETAAGATVDASTAAELKASRVDRELKDTARHLVSEQQKGKKQHASVQQQVLELGTQIRELQLSEDYSGTLTIEGRSKGTLLEALKPLLASCVAEMMERQGDIFAAALAELSDEVRLLEQDFDERLEQSRTEITRLRAHVDSAHSVASAASNKADTALRATDQVSADTKEVLAEVQNSVAAGLRQQPAPPPPPAVIQPQGPSQAEVEARLAPLAGRLERLEDDVGASLDRAARASEENEGLRHATEKVGSMEKEMVAMLERQISTLRSDMESGEKRLASLDVKCVAAHTSCVRNEKQAKKLEQKVNTAQDRLDTQLGRLLTMAMQQGIAPPPGEGVPPAAAGGVSRSISAVPGPVPSGNGSVVMMTPGPTVYHGAAAAEPPAVESLWQEHAATTGQVYYYNTQTRETTWQRPAELPPPGVQAQRQRPPPPPTPAAAAAGGGGGGDAAGSQQAQALLGGAAARITALEQEVTTQRDECKLFEERCSLTLRRLEKSVHKQKRRNERVEQRVDESLALGNRPRGGAAGDRFTRAGAGGDRSTRGGSPRGGMIAF